MSHHPGNIYCPYPLSNAGCIQG